MRFSLPRFVLTAVACVVGAVLALSMLLARKAEACSALPVATLEDAAIKSALRSRAAGEDQFAVLGEPELILDQVAAPSARPDAAGDTAELWAVASNVVLALPEQPEAPFWRQDMDVWQRAHAHDVIAFPQPLTIKEKRKYHLRP